MKNNSLLALSLLMGLSRPLTAAISVTGTSIQNFEVQPPAATWTQGTIAGGSGTVASLAALTASIATIDSTAASGTITTAALAGANPVNYDATAKRLNMTVTGVQNGLLMGQYENATGAPVSSFNFSYKLTASATQTAAEQVLPQWYVSTTGSAGSWVHIPELSPVSVPAAGTSQTPTAAISLAEPWLPGAVLYLLCADDNASASPDPTYNFDDMTLAPAGVCSFTAAAGQITRNANNTPGDPADDTFTAVVNVSAGSNTSVAWTASASVAGDAANPASGSYGSSVSFTFPATGLPPEGVVLTLTDSLDLNCQAVVNLIPPAPPYILGKTRLNGTEASLYSAVPLPSAWSSATPLVFTNNGGGSDRTTQELRSETISLAGVPRPVVVVATFRANETSTGSNFEVDDNFSAEIIEDGGAPVSMIPPGPAGPDVGDGAASHIAAAGAEQPNGPPDGRLHGYTPIATTDPNPVRTAAEDYAFYVSRDELNPEATTFDQSVDHTFEIVYPVPDNVNTIALSFRGGTNSTTEFFTLSGVRVRSGNCDIAAAASGISRGLGVNDSDPSDDTIDFMLTVTGTGSTWTYGALSGSYGTPAAVSIPITESGLPQTVADGFDGACTTTFIVTAPKEPLVVTALTAAGTDFTLAAAIAAQNYVRPPGGTELGWTGGSADIKAGSQPAPNTTARYLDMNGYTVFGNDFLTEPVVISPSVPFVTAGVDLGAYTTSGSAFEEDDETVIAVEASSDPAFPAALTTTYFLVSTAFPAGGAVPLGPGGVAFYDDFKVTDPAIGYGTAAVPYPVEDFALTRRSVTFPRGTNTYVRMHIRGGPSAAGSEHVLADNIRFEAGACTLSQTQTVTRSNNADDDSSNDVFSATVNITAVASGASTGWSSADSPFLGTYGVPVTFGPFPVSGGPRTITVADSLDAACSLTFSIAPPACEVIVDTAAVDVTRNGTATLTVADDTVNFDFTVTALHGGTGWTSNIPVPGSPGTFFGAAYGTGIPITISLADIPSPLILTDRADPACELRLVLTPPHHDIYALGTLVPQTGAPSLFASSAVASTNGWSNPADGTLTMSSGTGSVSSDTIDATALGELTFTASLTVTDTSATSNFEASDTFRVLIGYTTAAGQSTVNAIKPYDADNNDLMNGYDDSVAAPYDSNPERDEFNRPLPGVPLSGQISHTFDLSAVIPAEADNVFLTIEGVNNSTTESYRLSGVRFTEKSTNPNADTDGDGVTNADEAVMGTDPGNPNSVLRLAQDAADPGRFSFTGAAGRFYKLYVSDDAAGTPLAKWTDAGSPVISGAGSHSISLAPAPGTPRRYYRLHVMEADGPWPAATP